MTKRDSSKNEVLVCQWAECESFCKMLDRAGVPMKSKWPNMILHLRGLKDDEFLSDKQKTKMHTLLLEVFEKKDFSDKSYKHIARGIQEAIASPYEEKLIAVTREALDLTKEVDKILGRQKESVISVSQTLDEDLAKGKKPLEVIAELRAGLKNIVKKIERDSKELTTMSLVDSLTGLANRRALDSFFDATIARWEIEKIPVALIMCDLDHFKNLNDTYGHTVGDQVLRTVGHQLKKVEAKLQEHSECLAARYGGEEFILLLCDKAAEDAINIAEDLRNRLESFSLRLRDGSGNVVAQGLKVTMSLGVASLYEGWKGTYKNNLIEYADKALYYAKSQGRNRIGIYVPNSKTPLQIHKIDK